MEYNNQIDDLFDLLLAEEGLDDSKSAIRMHAANRPQHLPVSYNQEGLWLLDQLYHVGSAYNMFSAVRVVGQIDPEGMRSALDTVVHRHEILRTRFIAVHGMPVQVIDPNSQIDWVFLDVRCMQPPGEAFALAWIQAEASRCFDLAIGPLLRAGVLALNDDQCVFFINVHHMLADGWSVRIMLNEIISLYGDRRAGRASNLTPLPVQYADFALWQREWLAGPEGEQHLNWWRTQLAGSPERLHLPGDWPRPPVQSYRGRTCRFTVAQAVTQRLRELARAERATLFMVLLAAFEVLLARLSGAEKFIIGSPVANRMCSEVENLIGFFSNMLPLRADLSRRPNFRTLVRRVRDTALDAYAHQELPFERLVEALRPAIDPSHHPLFQVMFTLNIRPGPVLQVPGITLHPYPRDRSVSKFDLTLSFRDTDDSLNGEFEFATDLFTIETITRWSDQLQVLLEQLTAAPERDVWRLPMMPEAEARLLLMDWNATAEVVPARACLHELISARARVSPDAIALIHRGRHMTYRALNEAANRLAHYLKGLGVGPECVVGVCHERSEAMLVALLAILKAGGAYLPLDPAYPAERLAYILADAGAALVLVSGSTKDALPDGIAGMLNLEQEAPAIAGAPAYDPANDADEHNLAYVIYTSGSTGRPKGVMITHYSLINFLTWRQSAFALSPADRVLQRTSFAFDFSVPELFWPLTAGAVTVLVESAFSADPDYIRTLVASAQVTVMDILPSLLRMVLNADGNGQLASLRAIFCGGEEISCDLVESATANLKAQIYNMYGPTEATVDAIWAPCIAGARNAPVPIGRPVSNAQAFVLDHCLQLLPIGCIGELFIGGVGLARGYLNRPGLTAERFVPNPFGPPGSRLYRTGDLARWRADGQLEFLGRSDHQVKVRGFRVELGEIEARLLEHAGVREAVVVAREDGPGNKRLAAYYVGDAELSAEALRALLAASLPDYMVPAAYMRLDALPLTPNGKLDRKALPAPEGAAFASRGYEAPRGEAEETLARLWAELLKVERVGRHDNFFELGGHSLLAVQLISRLREALGIEVPLAALFAHPMLVDFADSILDLQLDQFDPDELMVLTTVPEHSAE